MTIIFDLTMSTQEYIANSMGCHISCQKKPSLNSLILEKVQKTIKKHYKSKLARNFNHMIIVFVYNHVNTIIFTKKCCVPSFLPNKPRLNHFKQKSAKKGLKNL